MSISILFTATIIQGAGLIPVILSLILDVQVIGEEVCLSMYFVFYLYLACIKLTVAHKSEKKKLLIILFSILVLNRMLIHLKPDGIASSVSRPVTGCGVGAV